MDPSALIFVALAVAWAVYLVPKVLEHGDESLRSRTVSTFSRSMRVLARREPDRKGAKTGLVKRPQAKPARPPAVEPAAEEQQYVDVPAAAADVSPARHPAARRATKRRRNVLAVLLLAFVAVAGLAVSGHVGGLFVAVPVVLLAGWLVACRLMVKKERTVPSVRAPRPRAESAPLAAESAPAEPARVPVVDLDGVPTGAMLAVSTAAAPAAQAPEGSWDPVEAPLPTYVSKPVAQRSVRTIDLDSTGVWSSGRNASDSALAREAEQAERTARQAADERRRATGS